MRSGLITIVLLGFLGLLSGCVGTKVEKEYPSSTGASTADSVYTAAPVVAPSIAQPAPKTVTGNRYIGRVGDGTDIESSTIIRSHAYTVVDSKEALKLLHDTLTYVIIPYDLSGQDLGQNSQKYKRYKRVLELIQEHQRVENNISVDNFSQKGKNKFIILSKEQSEKKVNIESYNYKLANTVLDIFREKHGGDVFNSEGPFLITTTKNILFDHYVEFTFLYLNLSRFNDSALEQVMESYKSRLVLDTLDEVGFLEKLHYSLLSFATNFNADMHIIQSAVAGEL